MKTTHEQKCQCYFHLFFGWITVFWTELQSMITDVNGLCTWAPYIIGRGQSLAYVARSPFICKRLILLILQYRVWGNTLQNNACKELHAPVFLSNWTSRDWHLFENSSSHFRVDLGTRSVFTLWHFAVSGFYCQLQIQGSQNVAE